MDVMTESKFALGDVVRHLLGGDVGRIVGHIRTPMGMMLQLRLNVPNKWNKTTWPESLLPVAVWESNVELFKGN